ncbi:ATP-binding protein [Streptomyces sp. NPDC001927]
MLDEGRRRAARGTDVVVGAVECHGRPHTEAMLDGLETLRTPDRTRPDTGFGPGSVTDAGFGAAPVADAGLRPGSEAGHGPASATGFGPAPAVGPRPGHALDAGLDLDAVLRRRPEVVLVDELAHANPPGSRNAQRWQDVQELLAAGIDVVATLNIQHLESLTDVVVKITGVPQHDTVPDDVVRRAGQIELVDVPPESLRRRMAHGNIYPPEKIDAALANYFRPGNLTALRELALFWTADRVDEALRRYRHEKGIGGVWETRERVVVALTGGPEGETLIRRAARIAARSARGGALLAVHVVRSDGLAAGASHAALARQRRLVESVGGSYHSVVGDDVPTALVEFARAENATQLVLGTSRRRRLERFLTGRGIGETTVALSSDIDVHMVTHERAGHGRLLPYRRRTLPTSRRVAGPVAGLLLPVLLTCLLDSVRGHLDLTSEALLFLLTVVGVACIGGVASALIAALTASLLLNYWFVPPIGAFSLGGDNVLALGVFAVVAGTVAAAADRSLRLSRRAARATAEAETLSSLAGDIVRGDQAIPALLARTRETFAMDSAELVEQPVDDPDAVHVPVGPDLFLLLRGRTLPSSERRVLSAFAAHVAVAVERSRLAEAAAEIEPVKAADRMRTALLAAVSHDLRTPLAAGWAAVGSLRSPDVEFTPEEQDELLATADESMARLSRLVDNLLDMSRLQAGALTLHLRATTLEEVLPAALDSLPPDGPAPVIHTPEDLPPVLADPPLLERVLANLLANAVRHAPPGKPVLVTASALGGRIEVRVVDRGPGLPPADRERIFEPFQRLGDTDNTTGVGLGLALSRGLTEAMDGTLTSEDTPGGGLTMVVSLPCADTP